MINHEFWFVLLTTLTLCAGSFVAGRVTGRRWPTSPTPAPSGERAVGYRELAEGRARSVEVGVRPPGGGPFLLKPGPEVFKKSCTRCGSRFAYGLADVARDRWVMCPQCSHEGTHIA